LAVYCHQQLQVSGWAEDREANRRTAIDLARRAVQIATDDPTALGQAALVLGYFGEDINVALALIDRALALNPSSARAWYWSGVLRVLSARRRLVERAAEIGKSWGELPRTRQRTFLTTLIERIDVATTQIDVHLRPTRLGDLPEVAAVPSPGAIEGETQILSVPVQLRRFGREIKLLIDGTDPFATTKPNPRLIKLLIRARRLNAILARGNGVPFAALVKREGLSPSYFTRLVRLSYLAPNITQAILDGRHPPDLTPDKLLAHSRLPLAWHDQRTALDFAWARSELKNHCYG
jgi:tetratricopeptide (TPR) repeat protein